MTDLPEFKFTEGDSVRLKGFPNVHVELLSGQYLDGIPAWRVSFNPSPAANEFIRQRRLGNPDGSLPTNLYTEEELETL